MPSLEWDNGCLRQYDDEAPLQDANKQVLQSGAQDRYVYTVVCLLGHCHLPGVPHVTKDLIDACLPLPIFTSWIVAGDTEKQQ